MCPCVCLKVNMSILCGLEKLLDHCRERDFIWQRISFFRIPKVSILENYQFLFAFDWPVYSCFFSVSRQRSLKFVCARVCVFVWLWCLLDSDLCFCFLFFTEQKQNNIVANMDMHCFKKKVLLAKHGSDIIINHRFLYILKCVWSTGTLQTCHILTNTA